MKDSIFSNIFFGPSNLAVSIDIETTNEPTYQPPNPATQQPSNTATHQPTNLAAINPRASKFLSILFSRLNSVVVDTSYLL